MYVYILKTDSHLTGYDTVAYFSVRWKTRKLHCVSKKVCTFKLLVTLSNLNWFWKCLHCWKVYEMCCKTRTTLPTSPSIYNFPRYCSNMPKVRWVILYEICSTFRMLSVSAKISIKIWQSYGVKGGNFFETRCSLVCCAKTKNENQWAWE